MNNIVDQKTPITKDRLIAKMVGGVMMSVAAFNLISGGIAGIQVDMLQKDVKALEQQKSTSTIAQIQEIDAEIIEMNKKIDEKVNFLMPSVYSLIATGTIGATANIYNEIKQERHQKQHNDNLIR